MNAPTNKEAPAIEVINAAISTIENPSPENILADVELAISLVKQLKALKSNHPTLKSLIEALF